MRIGLDGIPLTSLKTGIGHYTYELALALARLRPEHQFDLLYPSRFPPIDTRPSQPSNINLVRVPVSAFSTHWWSIGLPLYITRNNLQLFHGTNYDVPLWGRCPKVLTINDLSLLLHPQTHEARQVRRARRSLALMARAATAVITPTDAVRKEVCEHLGLRDNKVFTVPDAPRSCFQPLPSSMTEDVRRRLDLKEEFLLSVGTIEPRKNLVSLVRAFTQVLKQISTPLKLVIVGKQGWLTDPLFAEVESSGIKDLVVFSGYLSDDELCALYSSCLLFIYPSIYEGFGLPPLEAMACGASVITSSIPSLRETTGSAAYLFDPDSEPALAKAILDLLHDPDARKQLSAAGKRHAKQYSWTRTAELTIAVYEEALKRFRS